MITSGNYVVGCASKAALAEPAKAAFAVAAAATSAFRTHRIRNRRSRLLPCRLDNWTAAE